MTRELTNLLYFRLYNDKTLREEVTREENVANREDCEDFLHDWSRRLYFSSVLNCSLNSLLS